jgi:hypothetical protein
MSSFWKVNVYKSHDTEINNCVGLILDVILPVRPSRVLRPAVSKYTFRWVWKSSIGYLEGWGGGGISGYTQPLTYLAQTFRVLCLVELMLLCYISPS